MNMKLDEVKKKLRLCRRISGRCIRILERLDLIINQMRVLNSNTAATYELTSRVVAKLMERGIAPLA